MLGHKRSKLNIREDKQDIKSQNGSGTNFVQVKNSSRSDSMSSVDFVYDDVSAPKKPIRLVDQLRPQQLIKFDFAKAGISAQVVTFHMEWQFQGVGYWSHVVGAKPGNCFYSVKASLKPDGSSEVDMLIQIPLQS